MKHFPSLCVFVTLVIQGGAMAKFWPLHHSQCMGENLVGEGACQPDILNKSSWGCELSYETLPICLCAL